MDTQPFILTLNQSILICNQRIMPKWIPVLPLGIPWKVLDVKPTWCGSDLDWMRPTAEKTLLLHMHFTYPPSLWPLCHCSNWESLVWACCVDVFLPFPQKQIITPGSLRNFRAPGGSEVLCGHAKRSQTDLKWVHRQALALTAVSKPAQTASLCWFRSRLKQEDSLYNPSLTYCSAGKEKR